MLKPNPPRMVTVLLAVAMILVGLSATVFPIDFVNEALAFIQGQAGTSFVITTEIGWLLLFVGDALLVIGSLLPGI